MVFQLAFSMCIPKFIEMKKLSLNGKVIKLALINIGNHEVPYTFE